MKAKTLHHLYMQLLFVALSFGTMIFASYSFLSKIERNHLENQVEDTLSNIESLLTADLKEFETMLNVVSETIRIMLLSNHDMDELKRYMVDITNYKKEVPGFFGFFAGFGEDGLDGFNALHPDANWDDIIASGYNPKERPWYKAAESLGNEIAITEPYVDEITKDVTFTYVRNIYDNNGKRLGIICLDVSLSRIYKFSINNRNNDLNFWVLHDKNQIVIAHPNPDFVGLPFSDISSGHTFGRPSLFSMRPFGNGWFLGVVTYTDNYKTNLRSILLFLVVFGLIVATALSIGLVAIHKKKELAEQSNRQKSTFLANMSHEIRTPMNAILGIAEMQLQHKDIPPEIEDAFDKIHESGNLLLGIINDILDLSKIEAGKMELIPVKYSISSLINDTITINIMRYEKPIEFKLNIDENTPLEFIGDELRIKQILNNILSNAFKYTDKGTVTLSVSVENSTLIFTVSDTGQGMTKEQLGKLFSEYTRFNMEANRTTIGAGLGMSITKRLVNMMNGEIFVESEPGKGSTFTVCIPQESTGAGSCGPELASKLLGSAYKGSSIKKNAQFVREHMPYGSVLIVDDVHSNLHVAKGMLMPYGLQIDTAKSGFEAIEKVKQGKTYDIVFMDHMMPKMDGIETTKILREMGYTKPIVALTANALAGQAEMFLSNGFDAYISKPIDSRELNAILNEMIRNNR